MLSRFKVAPPPPTTRRLNTHPLAHLLDPPRYRPYPPPVSHAPTRLTPAQVAPPIIPLLQLPHLFPSSTKPDLPFLNNPRSALQSHIRLDREPARPLAATGGKPRSCEAGAGRGRAEEGAAERAAERGEGEEGGEGEVRSDEEEKVERKGGEGGGRRGKGRVGAGRGGRGSRGRGIGKGRRRRWRGGGLKRETVEKEKGKTAKDRTSVSLNAGKEGKGEQTHSSGDIHTQ